MAPTPTLMGIPRELRDQIWEQVYGTPTQVRLACDAIENSYKQGESHRFPEPVVAHYPPTEGDASSAQSDSESADANDDDGTQEKGEEGEEGDEGDDGDEDDEASSEPEEEPIDFDVDDFLENHPDSDDEGYLDDSDEESAYEEEFKGYKIFARSPVNTSLLQVSRQIHEEAAPYFYASLTPIFEYTAIGTMRFLLALPQPALNNIKSIGLTSWIFMDDDKDSLNAWNGSIDSPLYRRPDGPTLITPFASFLASYLPKLEDIYYYTPTGGDEEFYCLPAMLDLHELLDCHCIKRLHHVFLGGPAAKILTGHNSEDALELLMGRLPNLVGYHWYRLLYPEPERPRGFVHPEEDGYEGSQNQVHNDWFEEHYEFVEDIKEELAARWTWGDRKIDFGGDGNVQAVITVSAAEIEED